MTKIKKLRLRKYGTFVKTRFESSEGYGWQKKKEESLFEHYHPGLNINWVLMVIFCY